MAQILVKTPITSNGINPVLDAKGQIRYKETILEAGAKPVLEKINEKLPDHLKKIITPLSAEESEEAKKPKAKAHGKDK